MSYKAQDAIEEFASENSFRSEEPVDIFDSQYGVHLALQQILGEIDSIKTEGIEMREKISKSDCELMAKDFVTDREIEYCSQNPENMVVKNFDEGLRIIVDRLISSSLLCVRTKWVTFKI